MTDADHLKQQITNGMRQERRAAAYIESARQESEELLGFLLLLGMQESNQDRVTAGVHALQKVISITEQADRHLAALHLSLTNWKESL